ncbi:MAG: hypothetical protein K0R84_1641, partial [Clostridia bacterium]|nr:hypothetical protein [Clostridia bacterium]
NIDVSLGTLRTILLVKGQRKIAAFIGFFEVMIYLVVLGNVVGNIDKPILIVAYGLGYASGNVIGSKLEERLSIGRVLVQIILKDLGCQLVDALRDAGFGVTIFEGHGMEGSSYMLNVITERKKLKEMQKIINEQDNGAFVTTMDIRSSLGGYFQPKKL